MGEPWTIEREDALRKLHAEGLAFSLIGVQLGISRNAAIGKAARLGLDARPHFNNQPVSRLSAEERSARAERIRIRRLEAERRRNNPAPIKQPETAAPDHVFLNIPLLDLGKYDCRYTPSAEAPFLFCGQPAERGSYCGHCYRIVYTPHRKAVARPFIQSGWMAA